MKSQEIRANIGAFWNQVLSKYQQSDGALGMVLTLEYRGYDDWFLPSEGELELLFKNLPNQYPKVNYWSSTSYWKYVSDGSSFSIGKDYLKFYIWNSKRQIRSNNEDGEWSVIAVRRF